LRIPERVHPSEIAVKLEILRRCTPARASERGEDQASYSPPSSPRSVSHDPERMRALGKTYKFTSRDSLELPDASAELEIEASLLR
jgi:hypothetical protein